MKHQYFGDIIDLFKYDLQTILCNDLALDGITFVPMLTDKDGTKQGSKRNYEKSKAGTKNIPLIIFLKRYDDVKKRKATEIQKYFNGINIQFKFLSDQVFSHKKRDEYFSQILQFNFHNQLLFFDPDNGLEVKHNNHKHILYSNLRSCLDVINDSSIISVIQFKRQRTSLITWTETIEIKLNDLKKLVSPYSTYIADNNISFFIIAKSEKRLADIRTSLANYKTVYQSLLTK